MRNEISNEDFEKAVLGHCLRFPEKVAYLLDNLSDEDFSTQKLKIIYASVESLHKKKSPIDVLSVSNEAKSKGWNIPPSELIALEEFAIDGAEEPNKRQLKNYTVKRKVQTFLSESLEQLSHMEDSDLENIPRGLAEILSAGIPLQVDSIKSASVLLEEIRLSFDRDEPSKAVQTGLKGFDDLLGGLRPNELTELTGETGSGKTTFAVNLSFKLAKKKIPILIASFEMKPATILRKLIQMESRQPMSSHTLNSVSPFLVSLSWLPVFFLDQYGEIGLPQLKEAIFYARRRHKVEFAILDHLHFFLKYSGDRERQAIDRALTDIKAWAMELGIHIILIVHPTKIETENRPIRLNDLKGSSGLKQIPDNVLSLWRPRNPDDLKHPQSEVVLYVLKVRDDSGDEGKVILTFDKRSQSYSDSGPGLARPVEGERFPASSPSSRKYPAGKDSASGYDS